MKKCLILLVTISTIFTSCSSDEDNDIIPTEDLNAYQKEVVTYFKEIALGFEFGNSSEITRKWNTDMKIFVGGSPTSELLDELELIKNEINALSSDGFSMEIVADSAASNYYIFMGSASDYAEKFPDVSNLVSSNWGLFSVFWNGSQQLYTGYMYVDIFRANAVEQRHLLREELTQSLGLAKDSFRYDDSIFQMDWTRTTSYAEIDRDIIRLLYHPNVASGLNSSQVDVILKQILLNE